MKIAISGHRCLCDSDLNIIRNRMVRIVRDPDVVEVIFGGATGADTEALRFSLQHRRGPQPCLTVVVPDTLDMQAVMTQVWSARADRVIELRNKITPSDGYESYRTRNRFMVDQIKDCGELNAFWTGNYKSGTGHAVRYAQEIGAAWEHIRIQGEWHDVDEA